MAVEACFDIKVLCVTFFQESDRGVLGRVAPKNGAWGGAPQKWNMAWAEPAGKPASAFRLVSDAEVYKGAYKSAKVTGGYIAAHDLIFMHEQGEVNFACLRRVG